MEPVEETVGRKVNMEYVQNRKGHLKHTYVDISMAKEVILY